MGKSGAGIVLLLCFCLAPATPDAPPINEPPVDGQIVNPADVHMQAGPFNDPAGGTHQSSSWEIRKISTNEIVWSAIGVTDPGTKVHIHLGDGAFVGSYAGRTTMEFDTDYRLHVRFTSSLGQTGPDSLRTFRTSPTGPPGIPGPMPWQPREPGFRVEQVASGFRLPVNIAFTPNPGPNPTDPFFYVTELYGTIKLVRRNGTVSTFASSLLNYDPSTLGTFPGAGEQGLAGICIAPNGDFYVTMLEDVPGLKCPKIARLTSLDGGITGSVVQSKTFTTESQGPSHQISNISIGPDGFLYVHVGDGYDPAKAADLDSVQGKILRMKLDLDAVDSNPYYDAMDGITARDYIFAFGLRNPFGGAWRQSDGFHYIVENGPTKDRLARIVQNRDFGYNNTDASMGIHAIHNWTPPHAPVNLAFIQTGTFFGSGFPVSKMDRGFVTLSGPTRAQGPVPNGKRIDELQFAGGDNPLAVPPATLAEYIGTGYATTVALAAGPDGLYFSDLYLDQPGPGDPPAAPGANVLRIRYTGVPPAGTGTGFEGEYFPNTDLAGTGVVRTDPVIDFFWPDPTQPHPSIPDNNFSVRWRGQLEPPSTDPYLFYTESDDGVRLWINNVLVIDNWTAHGVVENTARVSLLAGQKVPVVMEYYERGGDGIAKLSWSSPGQSKEVIPQNRIYAPPPTPPAPPPARKNKKSCGATGLEVVFLFLLLRAIRRAY
jgi:hypothetical protein